MAEKAVDKICINNIAYFRERKLGEKRVLTNDLGEFVFLSDSEYGNFLKGSLDKKGKIYLELQKKGFIASNINLPEFIGKIRSKKNGTTIGPVLHIIIVTLRCNFNCIYCHASASDVSDKNKDMDFATAKKVVDAIFQSPSHNLDLEFQGGEPLLNWEVVKFIVDYAREKEKLDKKNIVLKLVSNFSLMDDKKLRYLLAKKVSLCASLDGPENIHNRNRIYMGGNGYKDVVYWLKKSGRLYGQKLKSARPGALTTITRFSLPYGKEIVNEYLKLGIPIVYLRPLNPFGVAGLTWKKIGYSADEFIAFYKKTLNYIISLNKKGKKISESLAVVFLTKILTATDPNHLDYRSPCGAAIGQIAYNFNGNVYTCDEGRMFSVVGDESFLLGNVHKNTYKQMVGGSVAHAMCEASLLENIPGCHDCAYSPYCGVCPIYNYSQQGSIIGQMPTNNRCKINKAIFDHLFTLLQKKENRQIFEKWFKY